MTDRMRATTVYPEWGHGICHYGKNRENRSHAPPSTLAGVDLCIHSGKYIGGKKGDRYLLEGLQALRDMAGENDIEVPFFSDLLPTIVKSAIVAVVRVNGYEYGEQGDTGWYEGAPWYGWKLEQVRVLAKPVPCKGAQGLWFLPDDVAAKVRAQLEVMT